MALPLRKDPHKQEMLRWFLARCFGFDEDTRAKRYAFFTKMLKAEESRSPHVGAKLLQEIAWSIGRTVSETCGYWGSEGDYCQPALCVRGFAPDFTISHMGHSSRSRWDLCWTGTQWEFDVKENAPKRRKRRSYW